MVLAAMDRYMHAISANDLAAMNAMQAPEGMTVEPDACDGLRPADASAIRPAS